MEKKCNCHEPYNPDYFQAGYPYCPIHDKPVENKYTPCVGCGVTNPDERCIGCFHAFEPSDEKNMLSGQLSPECDLIYRIVEQWGNAIEMPKMEGWLKEYAAKEKLTIDDYESVLADHRRLIRELDIIINGDNAAKQASLVDMVCQIRNLWPKMERPVWVKATEFNIEYGPSYYAKWQDGKIKATGWFRKSDDTFIFNVPGYIPISRHEQEYLYILDESS